jgi:hypothetical protein
VKARRYAFAEVRAALHKHWGLSLHRGGADMTDGKHDGRWDVTYSRTGYVVGGQMPRGGHGYRRYVTLKDVVASWGLAKVIAEEKAVAA